MDKIKIRSILQDALEKEIPSSQIELWPAVKANLVAGEHRLDQQGDNVNTTKLHRVPRLSFAVLTAVAAALLIVALVTPQGRALAQNVLQFFVRAPSTTFPLGPSQIATSETASPAPTTQPPAPLISVAEAEAQAGFEIAELSFVPRGFNYLGVRLYNNAAHVVYRAQDYGGNLIVQQSQEGFAQSDWNRVPANAIVPVEIGETDGEFAQGTFVVYPGETTATWEPDAPILRLRWVKDGVWFEMTKFGYGKAIEYLDQEGMIELAESLAIKP